MMKKLTVLMLCLFFVHSLSAQDQQAIRITNQTTQKEFLIKENKRILVETTDGEKYSGRFSISNNTLIIDNKTLDIADIQYLKRNTLLTSTLTTGLLVYGGAITAGFGAIIGVFGNPAGFFLFIPAAGMIYAGIKSPNFHKKYKTEKDWTFETETLSQ
ncbi:hypothetical protein [Aquiflexum lacus]|uniref:hypothetical protein n=1 Tax=Aquiflexum lacus TaxID=2483805 RepID=UPI001893C9C1|nr:hypothetical protein [Aquiflexum lacus]